MRKYGNLMLDVGLIYHFDYNYAGWGWMATYHQFYGKSRKLLSKIPEILIKKQSVRKNINRVSF